MFFLALEQSFTLLLPLSLALENALMLPLHLARKSPLAVLHVPVHQFLQRGVFHARREHVL
jgi:hypothetical protein